MNGTHQVLTYADDVNLIGDDMRTTESNADLLLNACKDIGLAVNTRKTKYMEAGRHPGMTENEHIRIGSNSFGKVNNFKNVGFIDKSKFHLGGNKMNVDFE